MGGVPLGQNTQKAHEEARPGFLGEHAVPSGPRWIPKFCLCPLPPSPTQLHSTTQHSAKGPAQSGKHTSVGWFSDGQGTVLPPAGRGLWDLAKPSLGPGFLSLAAAHTITERQK